jgi:hypothetical protein
LVSGANLHKVDLDIASSVSTVNISRLSMSPGVRYYSNVVANTLSGLQTTVSSDGIMVDSTSPVSGTVYDGNPSYTVPDTGLVLSTIIPSDDTGVCSPDNVYYTQILT